MDKTETPIKECKLLQYLIQTGDDTDTFRMSCLVYSVSVLCGGTATRN